MANEEEEQDNGNNKPKWKKQTDRERQDRYLESQGLLNYQTKNLSQQEIANRYAKANVRVDNNWYKQNYGVDQPAPNYAQQPQTQTDSNWSEGQANPNGPPPPKPLEVTRASKGWDPAKTNKYFYQTDPNTGLTVKMRMESATAKEAQQGQANWTDVFIAERERILKDPNFYKTNQITQYPQYIQQQILADPAFKFDQLADWQKPFYEISSNPKIMASPMAIAGAHAGAGFGLVGRAAGAAAGYGLGLIGGQDFNPAGNFKQQPTVAAKAMYLLNELAQVTEQAAGYTSTVATMYTQSPETVAKNKEWMSDPANRKALWEASMTAWDYGIGAESQNVLPVAETFIEIFKEPTKTAKIISDLKSNNGGRLPDDWLYTVGTTLDPKLSYAAPGEGFVIGANKPIQIGETGPSLLGESLNVPAILIKEARYIRDQVDMGRDANEVVNEVIMRGQETVGGQLGDFAGQAAFDPLELMGEAQSVTGRTIAKVTGNKVAEAAFTGTNGLQEAASKYRSLVQTQGLVSTIDPNFRVDNMGWLGRLVAGATTEGKIRAGKFSNVGLLDETPKMNIFQEWTTLTPGARAELGKNLFYENVSALLSTFEQPEDAANFLRRVASGENEAWAEMGSTLGNSPEWYTVQPALKSFAFDTLDKRVTEWQTGAVNRDALLRIADILGQEPGKLIDDLAARDTHQQDFTRIVEKARNSDTPEARGLLADVESGMFKAQTLKDIVDLFHGEAALPWHPGQWQASMLGDMSIHFDDWVSKALKLEPDSFTFRTAHLLKAAQSILLLGGNPGYAITNGISNMVHRAATGIYGYLTPNQINGWMDRFGVTPTRLHEGFGMAGEYINQADVKVVATDTAIRAAQTETKGALAWASRAVSAIGNKMPMTKLSAKFEKLEGTQGYVIAMKNFWGQTWRRNVGFKEMPAELKAAVKEAGIDPNLIHSAIEAGMNQTEIERAIFGRAQGIRARSLVHEAAQMGGMTSQQAAEILEKTGVLDSLDNQLANATTRDKVMAAFDRAYRTAQNKIDMDAARDMVARAEGVSQRLNTEGSKALVDIATEIEEMGMQKMIQHYERMGLAADSMDALEPQMRKITWEKAYGESTDEYRRFNALRASTYLGVMKGLGLGDNPLARQILATMGDTDSTMDNVYRYMREQRNSHFDKWRDDWDNPLQYTERDAIEYNIDKAFKKAFAREDANTRRMADLFGQQYEALFKSKETGEAARQAYEQIGLFRKEMVSRQQGFRDEQKQARVAGVPLELRQMAAKKFWGETYQYMIIEMARIKQEAITKLDQIAKDGAQGVLDEAESARLKEDIANREQAKAERTRAVWDIAEGYWAQGGNFDRSLLGAGRDKHALINALRDEKYGGLVDLRGLDDERLTVETVRSILNARDAEVKAVRAEAEGRTQKAVEKKQKAAKDITLLRYIATAGGLNDALKAEFPDARYPNLFKPKGFTTGFGIDEMAVRLAVEGKYKIDLNRADDIGGVKQTTELIREALRGEKIYPIDHVVSDKTINAAEVAAIEQQKEDAAVVELEKIIEAEPVEPPFNATEWVDTLNAADDAEKLNIIADMPNDLDPSLKAYGEKIFDEVIARQIAEADQEAIAESMTRAQLAVEEQQQTADIAMTRERLEEKYRDAFPKATSEQIGDWMKVSDAVLEWIGKQDGKTKAEMYEKYADVLRGEDGDLMQDDWLNASLTPEQIEGYARSLVRAGEGELKSAVRNEPSRSARVALLDAVYKLNPKMAENVARQAQELALFQSAKGGVKFVDGKAIISAWEGGDISTIVHENAHVFLDMMTGIARDGNVSMLDDLGVFQDWVRMEQTGGVDNVWTAVNGNGRHRIVKADDAWGYQNPSGETRIFDTFEEAKYVLEHEMFARGFERYMIDGKAPTKALARVFKNFKKWLRDIYVMITGSAIDVNLTPEMRAFFDKMLGGEAKAESGKQKAEVIPDGMTEVEARAKALEDATGAISYKYVNRLAQAGYHFEYGKMDAATYEDVSGVVTFKYADRLQDAGIRAVKNEVAVDGGQLTVDGVAKYSSGERVVVGDAVSFMAKGKTRRGVITDVTSEARVGVDTGKDGVYTVDPQILGVTKKADPTITPSPSPVGEGNVVDMFPAGEDMPLFSQTAQGVQAETFTPVPEIKQESMFETRPEFGNANPTEVRIKQTLLDPGRASGTLDAAGRQLLKRLGVIEEAVQDGFYKKIKSNVYEDLSIETHGNNIYFTQYVEMGGDLVIDTETVLRIKNGSLELVEVATRGIGQEKRGYDPQFAKLHIKNLLDQFTNSDDFTQKKEQNLAKVEAGVVEETPKTEPAVDNRESRLLNALVEKIEVKDWFEKSRDFEAFIKNLGFNLDDEGELNLAYDIMEGAYNMQARKVRADLDQRGAGLQERIEAMDALESNLTEARRTLGKMKLQQFSTPITISEAAGWVADVRPGDTLGEPTAGTANLVDKFFGRTDITLKVNEIDAGRQQVLSLIGYEPSGLSLMDSEWVIQDGKKAGPWATNVITNPPWGAYSTGKYGSPVNVPVKMNDWSQRFTYLTLQRMPDGGRLTGVMPANWLYTMDRKTRQITNKPSEFYKWLKKNYTVQAVIESLPGAYKQRGTDVSSLLVVIDKTPHLFDVPTVEHYGDTQPKTMAEYVKAVESVPKRTQEAVDNAQAKLKPTVAGPDASGLIDPGARLGEEGRPEAIGRPVEIPRDRRQRVGSDQGGDGLDGRVGERSQIAAELPREGGDTRAVVVEGQPAEVSTRVEQPAYSDAFTARIIAGKAEVKNSRSFAEYVGRAPLQDGDVVHPHPNTVVETKGLAGVPYPELETAYRPSPSVMRAMNNRALSYEGNIDPVWAAIQQNDKHNMGMLVADDVGMGKSRTGAAFVLDRIEKGKKKILVITKDEQNVLNLMNGEFPHVYNSTADENGAFPRGEAPTAYPAKRIFLRGENFPKVKKGEEAIPTFAEPTVYFVTASEFANFAPKIKELRADAVVVDEAHLFKNSDTNRGQAWTDLHKSWIGDKASMLYLTATPGVDLADLRYLYGLKVWSLDGFDDWVKVITGQESPEQMKKKQTARANVDTWVEKVQAAKEKIDVEPTTMERYGNEVEALKVGELSFFKQTERYNNGRFAFGYKDRTFSMDITTETEAIIISDMVDKKIKQNPAAELSTNDVYNLFSDAQAIYRETFAPPERSDIRDVGMKDASDILAKAESGKWGKKGLGAFESTLPPAHTEQIMRELKVAGSYMARDISRAGVDFGVKEYTPPAKAKASFNKRVGMYRRMYDAWAKFGAMNEGAKKAAALFGINGDIQADAKRALFNMRLPGIIDEARAAIERGEQAVISVVSVSEVDGETGSLISAIDKINTKKVEKIGKDTFSDPTEIPEALVEVLTLKEDLKDLESLPSPVDVLRDAFGDRIAFVTGATSTKDRIQAQQDFQNNKIDLIVISGAGKTGINLHDVSGKKRVHLIVGDYEWSATNFKQELGRVDRTGQRTSPMVTVMHTGSAGEKKFVATISNRMKGLGATSKGGAESTGTNALTDTFELGTTLDKIALNAAWQEFSPEWKAAFLDKYFRDPQIPDVSKSTLDTNAQALSKFLMGLQSIELETANAIMDAYTAKRAEIMNAGSELDDTAERNTAAQTGDITRQVELGDNLRMTEVRAADGSKYGIIDGVLTPHMNEVKGVVTAGADVAERYLQGGNAWMRWVQFFDEKKNQYVTGLRVKTSRVKDVAEHFGQILGSGHKPETAMIDLQAGDRIKVVGANVSEWELYMGRGGAREDKIVVDNARIKDKDTLMNNGASFSAIGNFFYVSPDNLDTFLKRFPIKNDAPEAKQPTLYQDAPKPVLPDADPRMPLGAYPMEPLHSEVTDEGWSQHVRPLLDNMREVALKQLEKRTPEGATRDMSQEGQEMLRKYMQQTKVDMAGAKLATIRWGENQRDFAMLNYKRRYGFDKYLEMAYPYQFYYTRSMMNWAMRALDKPAWFANYARLQRQQNRYERDIPERLRGKLKISAPWMPDWMGDAMYIDPMKIMFPFANFTRPLDTLTRDANSQQAEAERVLQEWAADGSISEADIATAAKTKTGATWERAIAEAKIRRESEISNPVDFVNAMFGPAWYLTTPWKMLTGKGNEVDPTPILNTTRAIDTVTQGTWAQSVGDLIGMVGKPEQMIRNKLGLPEFGEYGEYYIDRQLANMVADGMISSDEAQQAMIERAGATFDMARERVKYELAMRVPTAAALMAGLTADNFVQGVARMASTAPASMFGSGLLPAGELEYRGLKQEWNEAWKRKDAGDDKAINTFFDEHPEYEAYLAKGKKPEERLRSYLVGQIWDGYMGLGTTDRKTANAEMGELFQQAFLDSETRSYDSLDVEQLAAWAQMLNKSVPNTEATAPAIAQPAPRINTYDPNVTKVTDQYFRLRGEQFPNYYEVEQGYFAIPKSERASYMREHPELKQYWDFKDKWQKAYPEYEPILRGQVFKRIDTSQWSPLLLDYVGMYAMTGEPLGKGAWKALEQQWIMAGSPYGDVKSWLNSQVVPALLYSGEQP